MRLRYSIHVFPAKSKIKIQNVEIIHKKIAHIENQTPWPSKKQTFGAMEKKSTLTTKDLSKFMNTKSKLFLILH